MSPTMSASADSALVARVRDGDADAFGELWVLHSPSAHAFAASMTSQFDAADLVSEAFTRIWALLLKGKGPTTGFRRYLFRCVRNIAIDWARRDRHLTSPHELEEIDDGRFSEAAVNALETSLTGDLFSSLPFHFQQALWYSVIERLSPREFAPLLGMSANTAAQLACRAREAFRQAWFAAQLHAHPDGTHPRSREQRAGAVPETVSA